ncbi:uncharacterized protein [Cherax quadricarinatus]
MKESCLPGPSSKPKTLHSLVLIRLSHLLLENAVPPSLKKYFPFLNMVGRLQLLPKCPHMNLGTSAEEQQQHNEGVLTAGAEDETVLTGTFDYSIDDIILSEPGRCNDRLLVYKELLLQHMVKVKQWFDDEGWLGKQDSKLRKLLRESCWDLLQVLGYNCQCPLLLLTLELMFTTKAGFNKIVTVVPNTFCATLNNFLLKLQPFGIEKLYTVNLQFDCPSIVVTICKNSPLIKWIYLRIEFVKGDILREIGHAAPSIETVIVAVREDEIFEEISSTVEIVIDGGEGLEDSLYTGFFDGLDKDAVNLKIQNGEGFKMTFPKLKYVDVGIHRDVRDFLHHLLYIYPDIRSIMCDSEDWVLSKYSLNFPFASPSYLGAGPKSLQEKVVEYNLREMSFTSFCLCSKLHDITRFKKLEHISLHLLRGPWKIKHTSENAEELLSRISCQYLTIFVDVYMSNDDLLGLYTPSLQRVGSSLKILQFHLTNEVNVKVLCQLINMCQSLEELALVTSCERCEVEGEATDRIDLCQLTRLKCLSISSHYNVTDALYLLSHKLICSSTNLTTLELELGGRIVTEWLMEIVTSGALAGLKIFHLNLPGYSFDKLIISNFFIPLISALPHLSCLMLGNVCYCIIQALRERYRWSKLTIISRTSSYVAFRSLTCRCC